MSPGEVTLADNGVPILLHPARSAKHADYAAEQDSKYLIWQVFGWPYETTACMTRLIYSGLFDELPDVKIVTHHMGGMIPYFAGRIGLGFRQIFFGAADQNPAAEDAGLKHRPIDYYKMLYADTALNGDVAATRCGHAFFGTSSCLFATDAPFDPEHGRARIAGRAGDEADHAAGVLVVVRARNGDPAGGVGTRQRLRVCPAANR